MPPRISPTARQVRLGAELRKLREACGMSTREAGGFLGGGSAQISHIEAGRWGVSTERVRSLAAHYKASNESLVDELCKMAEERGRGWWAAYRGILTPGFLDVSELEHHAQGLRLFQITHVPGIFQTEDYARVVFSGSVAGLLLSDLDARVEHRIRRRAVYDKESPPPTTVVVHEAALRMRYGSRKVQRVQLEFLAEVAEWSAVTLRIIPFDRDDMLGRAQSMLYAEGPLPELDTVQLDGSFGGQFVDAKALLAMYRKMFDTLASMALSVGDSHRFLDQVVRET
ncbi:helix-turn-helix domain-containing protein [Streptomyces sp. NPDC052396]|uniref:helix-turn-helix domain-containing protein n=1 Tax=Streptomyces sp. NPDC052396 TaxID=3365689 RepID=UPI0037CCD227